MMRQSAGVVIAGKGVGHSYVEYLDDRTDRAWLEVNLSALVHNLRVAQSGGKQVMAVIKGDAHGQGAPRIGSVLEANGCNAFGVACLSEALDLRQAVRGPILILSYTPEARTSLLVKHKLMQTVTDLDYARALNAAAERCNAVVDVHIKLDTGMSRYGIMAQGETCYSEAIAEVCQVFEMKSLRVRGIFTHFSMADAPEGNAYTAWQLRSYNAVINGVRSSGIRAPFLCHTSNSAAILYHPEARFDMVRAGAMLFGVNPQGVPMQPKLLEQTMCLKARVGQVRSLPAGARVSYGGLYTADRPIEIAVVSVGFGDGYNRNWTGKGLYAVINGKRCPQIGRICMDTTVFDVTGVTVQRGDIAILYGRGGPSMDEIAAQCGTNNMEPVILCTKRVKRLYIDDDSGAIIK